MNVADRLVEQARRVGLAPDAGTVAAWSASVERIETGVGVGPGTGVGVGPGTGGAPPSVPARGPTGPSASSTTAGAAPLPDDGPWVWQAVSGPQGAGGGSSTRAAPSGHVGREARPAPPSLQGWRLAVKDLIAVGGRPLRAGSLALAAAAPEPRDAPPVAALRAAGAELVGTTKLHEFAFGVTGLNGTDGTPDNPAAPGRVPGGSSSGSAVVVAAGLADVALGTDTGGSARIPAALCGVVGYKPALGAVDTTATLPLAPTLDHIGWFTTDVAATRAVAEVLGIGVSPPGSGPGLRQLILGVHRRGLDGTDDAVSSAFARVEETLGRAGVTLLDVDWPAGEEVFATSSAIMFAEAAFVHRERFARSAASYGADVAARLVQGAAISLPAYLAARARRDELRRRCLAVLNGVDVAQNRPLLGVITPTTLTVAPLRADAADPAVAARLVTNTRLANVTGLPACSLPIGGCPLPVGLQIEALNDAALMAVAERIEPLVSAASETT